MALLPPANEVWGKVIFSEGVSRILFTEGASTWAGTSPGRYTPLGKYTTHPPNQVHPSGRYMLGDTGNKWAVRILQECILVKDWVFKSLFTSTNFVLDLRQCNWAITLHNTSCLGMENVHKKCTT